MAALCFLQHMLDSGELPQAAVSPEIWSDIIPTASAGILFRECSGVVDEEDEDSEEEIQLTVCSIHTERGSKDFSEVDSSYLSVLKRYLVLSLEQPTVCPSMNGDDDLRAILHVTGRADCVVFPFKKPCIGAIIIVAKKILVSDISGYSNLGPVLGRILFGPDKLGRDEVGGLKLDVSKGVVRQRLKRATSESALKRGNPVFDETRECVVITNANAEILEWDLLAENLFGWTSLEVVGRNIASFLIPEPFKSIHEKNVAEYRTAASFVKGTLTPGVGRMLPCVHKDGTILNFRVTMGEMKLEGQDNFNFCVVFQLGENVFLSFFSSSFLFRPKRE